MLTDKWEQVLEKAGKICREVCRDCWMDEKLKGIT